MRSAYPKPRTCRAAIGGTLRALACGGAMLAAAGAPAAAQGWYADRVNNSIVNADQIAARFREQLQQEVDRIGVRTGPTASLGAEERRALRESDRWWLREVDRPGSADGQGTPMRISLPFLYDSALVNSAQLRVFGDLPAIRETLEREVSGRFTTRVYAEGRYEDTNDATRSVLVTRGSERLLGRESGVEAGVRRRIETGGEITVGQRFLNLNSNSTELVPDRQSRSRTFITVVQPLLRDSGTAYVRSLHEVARLDARLAQSEFRRQAETHLLEIARAYWTLYLARSVLLQKERGVAATRALAGQIEGRSGLDADLLLVSRVRSAVAQREADLLRAQAAIRNAEARLRGLVNDPRLERSGFAALLPVDRPFAEFEAITLQTVLERAVALRPEVQQLFLQHRAAVLREGQAQIEALPRLDIIAEGNLNGRAFGTGAWGQAFSNNLSGPQAGPGGLLGLRFEAPLGADDLRARLDRRRLETRQIESQGRATLFTIVAEAEITLNEYAVAYRELGARALALRAASRERGIEAERWRQGVAGSQGEQAANALERLLSAQDRVVEAEERLSVSEVSFTIAFLALQRVQGTFTGVQNLEVVRLDEAARGPTFALRRQGGEAAPPVAPAVNAAPRPAAPSRAERPATNPATPGRTP